MAATWTPFVLWKKCLICQHRLTAVTGQWRSWHWMWRRFCGFKVIFNYIKYRNRLFVHLMVYKYTARPKEKVAHSPFALSTECIFCSIFSTTLCNVTTFISIQSYIHFWPRYHIDDRRVKPFLQSFPLTPTIADINRNDNFFLFWAGSVFHLWPDHIEFLMFQ